MQPRYDAVAEGDLETALFLAALHARSGVDFRGFKPARIQNKLEELVQRKGLASISALQGEVLRSDALGTEVVRLLSGSTMSSIGLVILLLALLDEEELAGRTQVFVTSASVAGAEMAELRISAAEMDELEHRHRFSGGRNALRSYFEPKRECFSLSRKLRACVTSHVHNLPSDASFREFQAIVCARPWDEYGDALQQRALDIFGDSLCAFGTLQLDFSGSVRTALGDPSFAPVLPAQGVYRRVPH
jgi:hypothetical protein